MRPVHRAHDTRPAPRESNPRGRLAPFIAVAAAVPLALLSGGCASGNAGEDTPGIAEAEVRRLRQELLDRMERDQEVRGADRGSMSDEEWEAAMERFSAVDQENTAWMHGVIDRHGWPTYSMVGKEASLAAFLLVQHADEDPEFQAECLPLLEAAVARGEASPRDFAYLTDRVRVKQNRPQLYGTQYGAKQNEEGHIVLDEAGQVIYELPLVEDVERLDERRAAAELGPWIDYEKRMAEIQGREAQPAPRAAPAVPEE